LQFEGLLKELLDSTTAGNAEISSEPAFMEMQVALEGKAGSQMGDAVIPAQPPNFKQAFTLCTGLLDQSKHLSLLVCHARAASGLHGFSGLADSLTLMHAVVEQQWSDIHPQEDKDDPDDPWWERANLLRELTDNPVTGDQLFQVQLVNVKQLGAFSKRDIDIAAGRVEGSDEEKERCNPNIIRGAFSESPAEELIATDQAMEGVIASCDLLDALFTNKIGSEAPSFSTLKTRVQECRAVFKEYAADKLIVAEPEVATSAEQSGETLEVTDGTQPAAATTQVSHVVVSTAFADRDEVAAAFDNVILFYQQYEPSSPVPILLFRARQMVHKNFFDILRELAPQHKDNFRELMTTLRDDPLTFLLEHSYNSFLNGETFQIASTPAASVSTVQSAGDTGWGESNFVDSGWGESTPVDSTPVDSSPIDSSPVDSSRGEPVQEEPVQGGVTTGASEPITSRNQVLQSLKDIQKFFEVQEPSSPVPLIVQRVITLVPKTFLDLLAEFEVTEVTAGETAEASGEY